MATITGTGNLLSITSPYQASEQGSARNKGAQTAAESYADVAQAVSQSSSSAENTRQTVATTAAIDSPDSDTSVPGWEKETVTILGQQVVISGHQYDTSMEGSFKVGDDVLKSGSGFKTWERNHPNGSLVEYLADWRQQNPDKVSEQGLTEIVSNTTSQDKPWIPPGAVTLESIAWKLNYSIDDQAIQKANDLSKDALISERLKAAYGQDIKLVYDEYNEEYIMMKPDDNFYDEARDVNDRIDGLKDTLSMMGYTPRSIAEMFGRNGIEV